MKNLHSIAPGIPDIINAVVWAHYKNHPKKSLVCSLEQNIYGDTIANIDGHICNQSKTYLIEWIQLEKPAHGMKIILDSK